MLLDPWRIELFGGLKAKQGDRVVARFRTQKTASLLAYLAYHLGRSHTREQLIDLLWPDDDVEAGRHSLRTALSSLRHQLEPPGVPSGTVLIADRTSISLNVEAVKTDVAEFRAALRAARRARDGSPERGHLERAARLYRGDLLPGSYEDWVVEERRALAQAHAATRERLRALPPEPPPPLSKPGKTLPSHRPQPAGTRSRLPLALTRFIGRQEEISRITAMLSGACTGDAGAAGAGAIGETAAPAPAVSGGPRCRIVTLTGLGGSGKTRLAIEAARGLTESYNGAVWFVPLSDVTDPRMITSRIADALGLLPVEEAEPLTALCEFLARRPTLLLLDNFEQLADAGSPVVSNLLVTVPELMCLVTSRQTLGFAGEQEMPVHPLPVPDAGISDPFSLACLPSVQLFLDRAQHVRPDFQLTKANAEKIATLCAQLEGIPLAIELAAARAGVLTPGQMVEQLQDRFELLKGRRPGLPERHRTLRAALEWSYRCLTPELQQFFAALSVFRGGWSASAAEIVCQNQSALDDLELLRERSLIVPIESPEEMRFAMLETMRELAQRQVSGEALARARDRHARHLLAFAEETDRDADTERHAAAFDRLEREHDNLRAALAWVLESGDKLRALRLIAAAGRFWGVRGHLAEGRQWASDALAISEGMALNPDRARVLDVAGRLARYQDDFSAALELHERSLAAWRSLGDRAGIARSIQYLGTILTQTGPYEEACRLCDESLSMWRDIGDAHATAQCLEDLACACWNAGDLDRAGQLHGEALEMRAGIGDRRGVAQSQYRLGAVALFHEHNAVRAQTLFWDSLAVRRELGERRSIAWNLYYLGEVQLAMADYAAARASFDEALYLFDEMGERGGRAGTLQKMSRLYLEMGDYERSRLASEESLKQLRAIGVERPISNALIDLAMAHLYAGRRLAGLAYLDEALRLADGFDVDVLAELAALHSHEGRYALAAQLCGALYDTLRGTESWPGSPPNTFRRDLLGAARVRLGKSVYAAAFDVGRTLSHGEALELALRALKAP